MGNSQPSHQTVSPDLFQNKLCRKYSLAKSREGYALILGNELETVTDEHNVGIRLVAIEETFRSYQIHVMTPFLNRSKNTPRATFSKEDFKRICMMHFDRDMLSDLAKYSSYFFYYCGLCSEEGVVTKDKDILTYSDIIKSITNYSQSSGKPIIFVFDCNYQQGPPLNIEHIIGTLKNDLGTLPLNTLICFSVQASSSVHQNYPPGMFTVELAQIIKEFHHLLPFTDMVALAGTKTTLRCLTSEGSVFQGPVLSDTLTAQFMFVPGNDDIINLSLP